MALHTTRLETYHAVDVESDSVLTYSLITPARDEVDNLRRLAGSLMEQTHRPAQWVIVDNGSRDGTFATAQDLADRFDWIDVTSTAGTEAAQPGEPVVRAFHSGLEHLRGPSDVVVKLDSDVSMDPDYFEALLSEFERDPSLGITSGVCYEHDGEDWKPTYVTQAHVRGATRAYRWDCLQQVLPLELCVGWDGIDELKANVHGWTTRIVPDLRFYHHRRLGARDGAAWARWVRQGRGAYYMGYRFSYLLLRSLHHVRRHPAAVAMAGAYLTSALRRAPRYGDERVRMELRERQRLRNLRSRRKEALGRQA